MTLHTIPLCKRISLVIIPKSPEISLALILQSSLDLYYALCWPCFLLYKDDSKPLEKQVSFLLALLWVLCKLRNSGTFGISKITRTFATICHLQRYGSSWPEQVHWRQWDPGYCPVWSHQVGDYPWTQKEEEALQKKFNQLKEKKKAPLAPKKRSSTAEPARAASTVTARAAWGRPSHGDRAANSW